MCEPETASCPARLDETKFKKRFTLETFPGVFPAPSGKSALRLLHPEDIAHLCFLRQNTSSRWVHVRVCVFDNNALERAHTPKHTVYIVHRVR